MAQRLIPSVNSKPQLLYFIIIRKCINVVLQLKTVVHDFDNKEQLVGRDRGREFGEKVVRFTRRIVGLQRLKKKVHRVNTGSQRDKTNMTPHNINHLTVSGVKPEIFCVYQDRNVWLYSPALTTHSADPQKDSS